MENLHSTNQKGSAGISDVKKTIDLALRKAFESYFTISKPKLTADRHLYLMKNKKICKVLINEITHIEVDGRYSYLFRNKEKYIISKSLKAMMSCLSDSSFIQSHRNTIVNKTRITEIFPNDNLIVFDNGEKTLMSGRYKIALIKELSVIK